MPSPALRRNEPNTALEHVEDTGPALQIWFQDSYIRRWPVAPFSEPKRATTGLSDSEARLAVGQKLPTVAPHQGHLHRVPSLPDQIRIVIEDW